MTLIPPHPEHTVPEARPATDAPIRVDLRFAAETGTVPGGLHTMVGHDVSVRVGGADVAARAAGVSGDRLVLRIGTTDPAVRADLERVPLTVGWAVPGGWCTAGARFDRWLSGDHCVVAVDAPPVVTDRRRHHRTAMAVPVTVGTVGPGHHLLATRTVDVSLGGLALALPGGDAPEPGTVLTLVIAVPPRAVYAVGRVTNRRHHGHEIGVMFTQLGHGDEDHLVAAMNRTEAHHHA